jgi:hypothetical protein
MINHKIYLVGQISSNPASYEWRLNLQKHLAIQEDKIKNTIELLDPCKNSMNLSLIRTAKFDEAKFNESAFAHDSLSILTPLDAGYVKASTIGFINMNHFTPERPIIGSYFELAWYYHLYPEKPTIGILDGDPLSFYHTKHPFVQASIHTWVKNEIDALNLIIKQCFC